MMIFMEEKINLSLLLLT